MSYQMSNGRVARGRQIVMLEHRVFTKPAPGTMPVQVGPVVELGDASTLRIQTVMEAAHVDMTIDENVSGGYVQVQLGLQTSRDGATNWRQAYGYDITTDNFYTQWNGDVDGWFPAAYPRTTYVVSTALDRFVRLVMFAFDNSPGADPDWPADSETITGSVYFEAI